MSAQSDTSKSKGKLIKLSAAHDYRAAKAKAKASADKELGQQDETVAAGVTECTDGVCSVTWKPQRPAA